MTRDEAIKMLKDYVNSERYERNDGTAMRFYHIVNMLCRANPDAAGASNERADAEKDAALTGEERTQLDGIVRCDPSWLLMDIKENSAFDAKVVEKVFELAKQQARAILAAKEKK
jgi:hypothetical protein